ncbi:MAG: flagellar hook-basal body complex protein [Magnetospirillum sp.]|nr:MAG: flagellar hook-basal body complex protein [Magnetospirillum sp.]
MSLYGALFSGVSGLASQSSAMGAISDNITNVNTIGYKGAQVNFQTLVTKQVSITEYSPGGVQSKPRNSIDVQGLLQATSSSTDLSLSGQGMFVVNTTSNPAASGNGMFAYTRAGSFKVDKEGYLQNVSGFFLQGWPLTPTNNNVLAKPTETTIDGNTYMKAYKDTTGQFHYVNQNIINPQEMKSLNLKTIGGTADQTTQIKMGANLPAGDTVYDPSSTASTGLHQTSVLMYDSLGATHNFNINWMKTNANTWDVQNKTNYFSATPTTLTGTSTEATAVFKVSGDADPITNGSAATTVVPAATKMGFFASGGVIAWTNAAVTANKLPVGAVFDVSAATTSANNGTYVVKTGLQTSAAIATNAAAHAITITHGTTTSTITGCTSNAGASTVTFGTDPGLALNDFVYLSSGSNTGYYKVTAVGAAPTYTLAAADYITVDTQPYEAQRGVPAPSGAAVMNTYDASGNVYGSQGRLDFTVSSRTDVLALNGKSMVFTVNGKSLAVTFDTTGTVTSAAGHEVVIDLSNTAYTSGSDVATLVANALRNPRNWDVTTNASLTGGTVVSLGTTLPLFRANGSSLEMVQQVNGGATTVNVSTLGAYCTQSQTRQWSSAIPSVDTITGTFILEAINQTSSAMIFNGDGTPQTINVGKFGLAWANGAQSMTLVPNGTGADQRITWFVGNASQADGMTQLGGNYQLSYLTQNGAKFGNFSGVSVGSDGVVTALFDNGVRRPVFQVPVATFTNPNGMESLTGNSWIETNISGAYTLRQANNAGAGSVNSASLEASTVDIGTEFTTMIVTQRAYSAAAKIITTADQMLDELVQIKR